MCITFEVEYFDSRSTIRCLFSLSLDVTSNLLKVVFTNLKVDIVQIIDDTIV